MKITQAQKDAWVDALRSGRYRQTRGHLKFNDACCCLGVKLTEEKFEVVDEAKLADTGTNGKIGAAYEELENQMEYAGKSFFATLNDSTQLSFEEIALVIENVPESEWK